MIEINNSSVVYGIPVLEYVAEGNTSALYPSDTEMGREEKREKDVIQKFMDVRQYVVALSETTTDEGVADFWRFTLASLATAKRWIENGTHDMYYEILETALDPKKNLALKEKLVRAGVIRE